MLAEHSLLEPWLTLKQGRQKPPLQNPTWKWKRIFMHFLRKGWAGWFALPWQIVRCQHKPSPISPSSRMGIGRSPARAAKAIERKSIMSLSRGVGVRFIGKKSPRLKYEYHAAPALMLYHPEECVENPGLEQEMRMHTMHKWHPDIKQPPTDPNLPIRGVVSGSVFLVRWIKNHFPLGGLLARKVLGTDLPPWHLPQPPSKRR